MYIALTNYDYDACLDVVGSHILCCDRPLFNFELWSNFLVEAVIAVIQTTVAYSPH